MQVKLVSITQSLIQEPEMTPEQLIVYIARVSNPSNQNNVGSFKDLIEYLIKHKHWSPFEMVDMTVEIVTSRAIAQQILRHRSFSFQEFSQRYSSALDFEEVELRKAGSTNRQSSVNKFNPIIDKNSPFTAESYIKKHQELCKELYDKLIDLGVAKECARFVLPLSTQTKIYMKGSIRSFIHYLEIRCGEDTQLEHRQVALAVLDIFKENFPNISENLKF